jgi:glycosyltransferase involved in cell wall biosynthesis
MVARLSPDKGVDLAIQAIALLRKKGKKVGLLVRGSGPELSYLRALSKKTGVHDFVRFLGPQSRSEMVNLYNSSELFLLASRKDICPFSLLEAGACGLPSVTTRVGSVEDFVQDSVNGLLVPPNSVEAIATGIGRLLADDNLRKAMGKEARRRFEEAFDMRVVAARLTKVYQDLQVSHDQFD